MAKQNQILDIAIRFLDKDFHRNKMIAIVEKNGNILSIGTNNMDKSHTCYFNGEFDKAVHAEYAAIKKAPYTIGTNIYIFRFLKDGGLANSRPCPDCRELIIKSKIRRIIYAKDSEIVVEKRYVEEVDGKLL